MRGKSLVLPTVLNLFVASATAATLHVPADYASIQHAIDASQDGDVVLVAAGTYFERIEFAGHEIVVKSEDGPVVTTIDGMSSGRVVTFMRTTRNATIEGFTITHGAGRDYWAGGILVLVGSATIVGNIVTENLGEGAGNGITLRLADALIEGNEITNNATDGKFTGGGGGGGIGVSGSSDCETCSIEIRNNLIAGNSIDGFISGGGIDLNGGGTVVIAGNVIRDNTAPGWGAGISMANGSEAQIENNLIVDNRVVGSDGKGGGVYWMVPINQRGPFLIGNTVVGNEADRGSGVFAEGFDTESRVANNIIVAADGGTGIDCDDVFDQFPPIVMNNDVYAPNGTAYAGLCASAQGTDGNLSVDPLFGGPGDYALQLASPAIDAGLNGFVTETTDLPGQPRIADGDGDGTATVDMGAYERASDAIFQNGFDG